MTSYDAQTGEHHFVQGCERGGGAPGSDPEPTPDEPVADDEVANCIDLGCRLEDPDSAQLAKIHAEIDEIRDEGFCGQVKANARAMVARHVQVWSNRVTITMDGKEGVLLGEAPWDYSRGGPVMYLYTEALNSWTIAHEAIHGLPNPGTGDYYTHSNITPLGLNLDATAKYCSRN